MTTTLTETTTPMSLADLIAWVAEHVNGMLPKERHHPSEQFHVLVTELHGGHIPAYVLKGIDPGSIISGEHDDTVFVRFEYRNGSYVELYPDWQPTEKDWLDYQAYLDAIKDQKDYVLPTAMGGLPVA